MKIERINKYNYQDFYKKFCKIKDFKVSKKIAFYEFKEIQFWINKPKDNLLYGVFDKKNECIGFCFCKILSNHWALIDNFYICKDYRKDKIGTFLQKSIEKELKRRNIKYISRVTRHDNLGMHKFLNKTGYKPVGKYIWFEKFI